MVSQVELGRADSGATVKLCLVVGFNFFVEIKLDLLISEYLLGSILVRLVAVAKGSPKLNEFCVYLYKVAAT